MAVGDFYSSKYLNDKLDLMIGERRRSMIGNIYFVKRWHLDKWILYRNKDRKRIDDHEKKCVGFFKQAIYEFEKGSHTSDLAHAYYNLAVKYKLTFYFQAATEHLNLAEVYAKKTDEKRLLSQISILRGELADKNRNIRNYVEELGLDLPGPNRAL